MNFAVPLESELVLAAPQGIQSTDAFCTSAIYLGWQQTSCGFSHKALLLVQLGQFRLHIHKDRDIGIAIFPECEEILVGCAGLLGST